MPSPELRGRSIRDVGRAHERRAGIPGAVAWRLLARVASEKATMYANARRTAIFFMAEILLCAREPMHFRGACRSDAFRGSAPLAQQQSATIRGVVIGPDGQPFPGATVTLLDQLGIRVSATETASTGRFLFDQVAPGTYTVFAETPPQRSDDRIVTVQGEAPN